MAVYIKAYRLINFQSWSDRSEEIELDTDIVNIIEGANETGKSVFFKAFYCMCFPDNYNAGDLIRRGCDAAFFILKLSNGYDVVFQLSLRHHIYAIMQDGEIASTFMDCVIPDEIVQLLGLVIDRESQVILNVIDKDVALPFVSSSPRTNAGYIRAIVEPQRLTDFFARADQLLKDVGDARSKFRLRMTAAHEAANILEFRNIEQLKSQKTHVDALTQLVKAHTKLLNSVGEATTTLMKQPRAVVDPSFVRPKMQLLDKVGAVGKCTSELFDLAATPLNPAKSPTPQRDKINTLNSILAVVDVIRQLEELELSLLVCVDCGKVKPLLIAYDNVAGVTAAASSLEDGIRQGSENEANIYEVRQELEKIRNEVGVCPTCGRLLGA